MFHAKKLIYVAGPFTANTREEVEKNIEEATLLGIEVAKLGASPLVPHANTAHPDFQVQPNEFWLEATLEILTRCDAVIFTSRWQESVGARGEEAEAKRRGMKVFYDIESLKTWLDEGTPLIDLKKLDEDILAQVNEVAEECAAWESKDSLDEMWDQQLEFMTLLCEKRGFPEFPVDITSKLGQKLLKDITHHCTDELFEASQHLKNSKSHRITEVNDIDQDAYVEELVDAQHLLFEIMIASGLSKTEFVKAYLRKGEINTNRILNGY